MDLAIKIIEKNYIKSEMKLNSDILIYDAKLAAYLSRKVLTKIKKNHAVEKDYSESIVFMDAFVFSKYDVFKLLVEFNNLEEDKKMKLLNTIV